MVQVGSKPQLPPLKEVPVVLILCLLDWDDLNLLGLSMAKIHRAFT